MGLIYQARNRLNNKVYIGQTIFSLEVRTKRHKYDTNKISHKNNYFYNALRKYGWDSFEWSILEENVDPVDLNSRETHWITKLDTYKNGYNSRSGGGQRTEVSLETKEKIRRTKTGRILTKEHKRKISLSSKGRKPSKLAQERSRLASLGNKWNLGRKHSQESIDKMSENRSSCWQITDPKGNIFVIKNLSRFCKKNGLNPSHMSTVAKRKRKHHKGWGCKKVQKF